MDFVEIYTRCLLGLFCIFFFCDFFGNLKDQEKFKKELGRTAAMFLAYLPMMGRVLGWF